jgi:hypothetical protein
MTADATDPSQFEAKLRSHLEQQVVAFEHLIRLQRGILTGMALLNLHTAAAEHVLRQLELDLKRLRLRMNNKPSKPERRKRPRKPPAGSALPQSADSPPACPVEAPANEPGKATVGR